MGKVAWCKNINICQFFATVYKCFITDRSHFLNENIGGILATFHARNKSTILQENAYKNHSWLYLNCLLRTPLLSRELDLTFPVYKPSLYEAKLNSLVLQSAKVPEEKSVFFRMGFQVCKPQFEKTKCLFQGKGDRIFPQDLVTLLFIIRVYF